MVGQAKSMGTARHHPTQLDVSASTSEMNPNIVIFYFCQYFLLFKNNILLFIFVLSDFFQEIFKIFEPEVLYIFGLLISIN